MVTELELTHRRDALQMAQALADRSEPTEATIDRARAYFEYLSGKTPATSAPRPAPKID